MTIVYVGQLQPGGTALQRMEVLVQLGHQVLAIDSGSDRPASGLARLYYGVRRRLLRPADPGRANGRLVAAVHHQPELVWIDKGVTIRPSTLRRVRALCPGTPIVSYSLDDMVARHNHSLYYLQSLPLYDVHFTNKSYNVSELRQRGARRVDYFPNAFTPSVHRPIPVDRTTRARLGAPVTFVGAYEGPRAALVLAIARAGHRVRVWAGGDTRWRRHQDAHPNLEVRLAGVWGDDYARALCSSDVNLGLLRKDNRDLQTTRSVEIPACGAFMLAERTSEHQQLFREGVEAEFFDGTRELLDKVAFYLAHPEERRRIAAAGRARCVADGYSYHRQLARMLAIARGAPGAVAGPTPAAALIR